jgi:site-specific recombinase XerD
MANDDGRELPPPPPEAAIPLATQRAITGFLEYLVVERCLSRHTQDVYARDVKHFFAACQRQGRDPHLDLLTPQGVREFLADRLAQGISPRTTARTLAALRAFDRYLRAEGLRSVLTLNNMESPRAPRPLPHTLSQQDIDKLLQQPSRATPKGLRDLAML